MQNWLRKIPDLVVESILQITKCLNHLGKCYLHLNMPVIFEALSSLLVFGLVVSVSGYQYRISDDMTLPDWANRRGVIGRKNNSSINCT